MALLLCAGIADTAHAQEADPWLGADKALHFGASAGIAAGAYAAGALFPLDAAAGDPIPRLAFAFSVALAAGVGKELYDVAGGRAPSGRDLVWDVAGTATGLAISYFVVRLLGGSR